MPSSPFIFRQTCQITARTARTPLPMKSTATGLPMRLHRKISNKIHEMVLVDRKVKVHTTYFGRDYANEKSSCRCVPRMLFLQENAPAHKIFATMANINNLWLQLNSQSTYSSALSSQTSKDGSLITDSAKEIFCRRSGIMIGLNQRDYFIGLRVMVGFRC